LKKRIGYFKISVIGFFTAAIIPQPAIFLFSFIADEMLIENENHFDAVGYNQLFVKWCLLKSSYHLYNTDHRIPLVSWEELHFLKEE
jgi:hypothetical protein